MPTTVFDQFYLVDANSPPGVGAGMPVSVFSVYDSNDNGSITRNTADEVDEEIVTDLWVGDQLTIDLSGGGQVTYTGASVYLADGRVLFTPTDGQVLEAGTFASSNVSGASRVPLNLSQLGPPCFRDDALIDTPGGARRVATLKAGDLVETVDHGPLRILHLQTRSVEAWFQEINPGFRPVRIPKDALGEGLPNADLYLSSQHRIAVSSPIVARMFGAPTVLVPVAKLIGTQGITQSITPSITQNGPRGVVRYCHIVLERHALVRANGLAAETFLLGPRAAHLLGKDVAANLLWRRRHLPPMTPARPIVDDKRVKTLLRRHVQNDQRLAQSSEADAL